MNATTCPTWCTSNHALDLGFPDDFDHTRDLHQRLDEGGFNLTQVAVTWRPLATLPEDREPRVLLLIGDDACSLFTAAEAIILAAAFDRGLTPEGHDIARALREGAQLTTADRDLEVTR